MVCAVARRVFSSSSQSHGPWVSAVASAPPLYVFLPPESAPEFGIAHDPINQEGARAGRLIQGGLEQRKREWLHPSCVRL